MSAHIYQYFDIWFLSWYNTDMVKVHLSWAERRNSSNLRKWLKIEILIVLTWYPKKSRNSEYDNFETEISFESPQKVCALRRTALTKIWNAHFVTRLEKD